MMRRILTKVAHVIDLHVLIMVFCITPIALLGLTSPWSELVAVVGCTLWLCIRMWDWKSFHKRTPRDLAIFGIANEIAIVGIVLLASLIRHLPAILRDLP